MIENKIFLLSFLTIYKVYSLDVIHGERYVGPVVSIVKTVGQKQCIKECQTRATLCKGISYKREELQCEIVSSTEEIEPFTGYLRIKADQVFQRRLDGSEDFYRTWSEYKDGFGNLTAEFWFGNEKLYLLLSQGTYELRMDMSDFNNQKRYVKYSSISLGNEASKYKISLYGFSGDVGDCFTSTNQPIQNMKFTTKDQDNDVDGTNCAIRFRSGWWHNKCHCANPNGLYLAGDTTIIGQQQCINECLARAGLCRGVNYMRKNLLCEIVSSLEETSPSVAYVRIKLDQVSNLYNLWNVNYPNDCSQLSSELSSGLYGIRIPVLGHVTVFCEMVTDGGGWTVFQRRLDGSEDFYRTWAEYKDGFGNLTAEFWFGNEKLYLLLSQGSYEMRMDMSDFDNQTRYVKYNSISLGNETSKYQISLSGFSGDVGTGNPINNKMFSTKDQDNDNKNEGNCAVTFTSGWWHNRCHCANPNGLYLAGNTTIFAKGITYAPWLTQYYSLRTVRLMVRGVV
ncbi:fibrinogen-like protein 1 [Saccostrea echinata]|uniref:fibrinogen-like protein 1 n=1 Tax=Saccostrea echinata TaxID=191078 RepID=UPI002A7EE4BC|nr:fibrinogen-like protein 1 [Saccostrea echinata]